MKITKRITLIAMTLAFVGLFAGPLTHSAYAADSLVKQAVVNGSVDDTLSKLSKMVADNRMMVMGELHQGKVLAMTGLKIQSESIFVGSPTMGKKLFGAEPGAGAVVPVRVNIYKNKTGKTVVSYIPPSLLLSSFGNPMLNEMAKMLDGNLAKMVGMLK